MYGLSPAGEPRGKRKAEERVSLSVSGAAYRADEEGGLQTWVDSFDVPFDLAVALDLLKEALMQLADGRRALLDVDRLELFQRLPKELRVSHSRRIAGALAARPVLPASATPRCTMAVPASSASVSFRFLKSEYG